jgi:hypothetical protein
MKGFLTVIASISLLGKDWFCGFFRFGHCGEPVGAFGGIPSTTIEAFPGGRVWRHLSAAIVWHVMLPLAWRNGVGLC